MRRGFWLRGLIGVLTAVIGVGIAWSGYALIEPQRAGLKALPPEAALLPFDRGFWAVALMLLGVATVLHALPHPPWTKGARRPGAGPETPEPAAPEPPVGSETAGQPAG